MRPRRIAGLVQELSENAQAVELYSGAQTHTTAQDELPHPHGTFWPCASATPPKLIWHVPWPEHGEAPLLASILGCSGASGCRPYRMSLR